MDMPSFLGMYPSDILPPPPVTRSMTLIVNTNPHTAKEMHCLAIHLQPRSYCGYFFDSIGLTPFVPNILTFLCRAFSGWENKTTQLHGLASTICGEYCCLFAIYMDCGYAPKLLVGIFDAVTADRQVSRLFASEFGPLRTPCGGQGCTTAATSIKGNYTNSVDPFGSWRSIVTR
jgi:hypothetical protein